jgi:cell division control protein 6
MGLFDGTEYIIQDRDILSPEHDPDTIMERDTEVMTYASQLRPVVKGWNPNNIFIYGDTGIGKTVVTRHVLDELVASVEENNDIDLNIIELNCTNTTTSYQVAVHLVNEVRKPSSEYLQRVVQRPERYRGDDYHCSRRNR